MQMLKIFEKILIKRYLRSLFRDVFCSNECDVILMIKRITNTRSEISLTILSSKNQDIELMCTSFL